MWHTSTLLGEVTLRRVARMPSEGFEHGEPNSGGDIDDRFRVPQSTVHRRVPAANESDQGQRRVPVVKTSPIKGIDPGKRWQPKRSVIRSNIRPSQRAAQLVAADESWQDTFPAMLVRITPLAHVMDMQPNELATKLLNTHGTPQAKQAWSSMCR